METSDDSFSAPWRLGKMPAAAVSRGFAAAIVGWQIRHGRHDLPWQMSRDPYAIWISEIMLQQTQVATVVPYYQRFMRRFPDVASLASASLDEVLQLWSGLGYYSRARNLHRAAVMLASEHGGSLPRDVHALAQLPGVGRSTAAAVAALAFAKPCAILDGNVKRVLCRCFGLEGDPDRGASAKALWSLAESLVPRTDADVYTQGMMDLGATVCVRRRPRCALCPLAADCVALRTAKTDDLPTPRARAGLPRREVAMLYLQHGDHILLEKRPAHGIWGGLWSLPEAEVEADLGAVCAQRFGARIRAPRALPVIKHGFTHFRLDIRPWHIEVRSIAPRAAEVGTAWLDREAALGEALPAPIRRILKAHET